MHQYRIVFYNSSSSFFSIQRWNKKEDQRICKEQGIDRKKEKNSSIEQLLIFQRGGKLREGTKRTSRSSEINRTNLITRTEPRLRMLEK